MKTIPEKRVWAALRTSWPDAHWRQQVPFGPYIVDFCSHAHKFIIELDGGQHAGATGYDAARTDFLERQGYRVLRFWNNDVRDNIGGVVEVIAQALSPSPSQPAAGPLPLPVGEGF